MVDEFDVVVIGMGPGGEEVAGKLAEAGLSVVGIDERLVGGECPYWGCVPSKMMIRAAGLLAEGRRIPGMAGQATIESDWAPVATRIRREATDNWDDTVAVERFEAKGGRFIRGQGKITGRGEVTVGELVLRASRAVVVATGTTPSIPPIPGLADTPFWTNHGAIETEDVPTSLAIIGGGAIGLELAQVFSRFGSQVTVIEVSPRILGLEEPESSEVIGSVFADEGIEVRANAEIVSVAHGDGGFTIELGSGPVRADRLMVATGRKVDLARIGVSAYGVDESARALTVDEGLQAGPGLWAVGDVTGRGAFTHVAMYQAAIAVADILGRPHPPADYRALPRVTFTDPEVGAVGLTEEQARKSGLRVRTAVTQLPESARGWIHGPGNRGFIKLVEDADRGVLVGATAAGPNGGEILAGLTVAVHGAVPVATLASMIYAYPTLHRAIETAVKQLQANHD